MAHFAQIDDNNIVINVLSVPDEQQHRGEDYLKTDLGLGGRWIQTSYNNKTRNMFAGVGYIYNSELDVFLPPKPFPSWIVDNIKKEWTSPIPRPEEIQGTALIWEESSQEWRRENLPEAIVLQSQ